MPLFVRLGSARVTHDEKENRDATGKTSRGCPVGDDNEDEGKLGKFGRKFKDSSRRVKTKAQDAAQRAAEQAGRAGDAISEAAGTAGEKMKQNSGAAAENMRDLRGRAAEKAGRAGEVITGAASKAGNKMSETGNKISESGKAAAESASELKDRAGDRLDSVVDALTRAGDSVSDRSKTAGTALSEEAQLALDLMRARFPELLDNVDDQAEIIARMDPQAHRHLIFAAAMFATKFISTPIPGGRFLAEKVLRRASKYVDEHKGEVSRKKQRGLTWSAIRWVREYRKTKAIVEKEKAAQEKGNEGLQ